MELPVTFDHCVVHVSDWERVQRFLPRRPRRGAGSRARKAGPTASVTVQLNLHGPGFHAGRGGAAAGPARQQRPVLRMERPDRRRHRPSRALRRRRSMPGRSQRFGAKGAGHQRLFPRSRRLAAGIHFVPVLRRRHASMTTAHDPTVLPADIPAPQDDGAARHLQGSRLPSVSLAATDGSKVDLSKLPGRTVRLHLSAHGRARSGAARRLGCDPRRARLHAAVVLVPRSLRRAEAARRRPPLRSLDPGHRLPARGGRAAASAVPDPVRRESRTGACDQVADVHGRRHDAAQTHGAGRSTTASSRRCSIRCSRRTRTPRR